MKTKGSALTLSCFGMNLISLFLPFYEGPRPGMHLSEDSFVIVAIYKAFEFNATMVVFNGFGSLFAITNFILSIILVFSHFFFPRSFATAISTAVIFVFSLGALIYATSEERGVPLPDSMLVGFYLMLICQVILITNSFTKAVTAEPKDKKKNTRTDLLDV